MRCGAVMVGERGKATAIAVSRSRLGASMLETASARKGSCDVSAATTPSNPTRSAHRAFSMTRLSELGGRVQSILTPVGLAVWPPRRPRPWATVGTHAPGSRSAQAP